MEHSTPEAPRPSLPSHSPAVRAVTFSATQADAVIEEQIGERDADEPARLAWCASSERHGPRGWRRFELRHPAAPSLCLAALEVTGTTLHGVTVHEELELAAAAPLVDAALLALQVVRPPPPFLHLRLHQSSGVPVSVSHRTAQHSTQPHPNACSRRSPTAPTPSPRCRGCASGWRRFRSKASRPSLATMRRVRC